MKAEELKGIVHGILFVKGEAISVSELSNIMGYDPPVIREIIKDLQQELDNSDAGLMITEVAGGFQLITKPKLKPYIDRLKGQTGQRSLSQAALETLAIIAYRQPITRVEIEDIRGVKVDKVLYTLLEKELVKSVGRKDVPGRPILFGTTKNFLMHFGLQSIEDLPRPEDFSKTLFDQDNPDEKSEEPGEGNEAMDD